MLKKSLKLHLERAEYDDQMKFAKASLMNIERGGVENRLSKAYYPIGDGSFDDIPEWKKIHCPPLVSKPRSS